MKKLLLMLMLLVLVACGSGEDDTTKVDGTTTKTKPKAVEVNTTTVSSSDNIYVDKLIENVYLDIMKEELVIKFYEEQVDKDNKEPLSFEPNTVKGSYKWRDKKTMVYTFTEFERELNYKVNFSIKEYLSEDYKDLSFSMAFVNPVMTGLRVDESTKGKKHQLAIVVEFNEKLDKEFILSNLSIALTGDGKREKKLNIKKASETGVKSLHILTDEFSMDEDKQRLEVKFFDQIMEEYISYSSTYYSSSPLKNYDFRESNEKHKLYLNFHGLKEVENIASYLSIEGLDKFYVKQVQNNLIVSGNFVSGKDYEIRIFKGLLGSKADEIIKVKTPNLQPAIEFKDEGVYLSDFEDRRLRVKTRNVKAYTISVKKVDEQNISWFSSYYGFNSGKKSTYRYDDYSLLRFGTELYSERVEVSTEKNRWIETDIDLSKLGEKHNKKGIYLVEVSYNKDDLLVPINGYEDEEKNLDARENYYFVDYLYRNAFISKTIMLSDIGVVVKNTKDRTFVYTSKISTGEVIKGAKVVLESNGKKVEAYSNEDGVAIINSGKNDSWRNIYVEADGEISMLNSYYDYVNYSYVDNGGEVRNDGINAYIYTERGVYRPGDKIHLSTILFEKDKKLPEDIELRLKFFTPLGKLYKEAISNNGEESLYTFELETEATDATGTWYVELYMGEILVGRKNIKVETVVAPKIKAENILTLDGKDLQVEVESEYLFGAPASELDYELTLNTKIAKNTFGKYGNYSFVDQSLDTYYPQEYRYGTLDLDGKGKDVFNLKVNSAPYKLQLIANTSVYQKDGRKVMAKEEIIYDFYENYGGVEKYESYGEIGEKVALDTILVDKDGNEISGELEYNVYRNDTYWWWDYSSYDSYRKHYKKSDDTVLIENGRVTSGKKVEFTLEEYGNYYVEVATEEGHRAGSFVRSGYYSYGNTDNVNFIDIETDKERYSIEDEATISFESDTDAYAIVNIERGSEILDSRRIEVKKGRNLLPIKLKEDYFPGVHINVIVLQNLREKPEDSSIRLQGLTYMRIERDKDIIETDILVEEVYKEPGSIEVEVVTSRPDTAFTLAMVDEGLLSLTRFKSPNAYEYFFAKERYNIGNYDNYKYILNYNKDEAYKTYVPGGGDYLEDVMMKSLAQENKAEEKRDAKRFKSVSALQRGKTDENGRAKITFEIDDYMGQVRFMLVAVKDNAFGSISKKSRIRGDVVMYPGLPRKLAPKDSITTNLNLFINEPVGKDGIVGIRTEGPIEVVGKDNLDIDLSTKSVGNFEFELKAKNESGLGKVIYYVQDGEFLKEKIIEIDIATQAPFMTYKEEYTVDANANSKFVVNTEAIKGSGHAEMRVSRYPLYNLYGRLQYLITYPYGCLEQTTSAIFPQLYLDKFLTLSPEEQEEVDKNINEGIRRIEKFQLYNGSLSYWINETYSSPWGSNYAHYFLIEAKRLGYYVPDYLINQLTNYQYNLSNNTRDLNLTNIHRLYILAMGGKANFNAMNYYKQNSMDKMDNREKFLLAGAFNIVGYKKVANNILNGIDFEIEENIWEDDFGSQLRDKALILDVLSRMDKTEESNRLNQEILKKLASNTWYSTQTVAYSLIAVSNYREVAEEDIKLEYEYIVDGRVYKEELVDANEVIDLGSFMGKEVEVRNLSDEKLYINYFFQGKMDLREQKNYEKELRLSVKYYDDNGNELDSINNLNRGEDIWAIYKVEKGRNKRYKNLALYQNLPSGLEIENFRINGGEYPNWVYDKASRMIAVRSADIRDDKMVWFFDMVYDNTGYFVLKLNPVSKGKYFMPGAVVEAMYSDSIGSGLSGFEVEVK